MKHFLLVLSVQMNLLFFSVYSILGYEYGGADESNSFMIVCAISAAVGIFVVLYQNISKKIYGRKYMMILPLLLFGFEYLRVSSLYSYVPNLDRITLIFFCYSVPAMFAGTYMANTNSILDSRKWFDFSMFIMSIGLLLSLPKMVLTGSVSVAGTTYQALSYMAAFCFGLNLYEILFPQLEKANIYNKGLRILRLIFIPLHVICTFLGGGRGAAILLILNALILLFYKGVNIKKYLIPIFIAAILTSYLISHLGGFLGERFEYGYIRAFSYLTDSGLDMSQTSGRDEVYDEAWKSILGSPIIGYGLLGYLVPSNFSIGYSPHNVILHILLQGGVFLLSIVIFLILKAYKKLKVIIRRDQRLLFLVPLILFPCINLLFSGDYLTSSLLWFFISYLVTVTPKQINE